MTIPSVGPIQTLLEPGYIRETERLAVMLESPALFIERRVETLDFQSDGTISVSTAQQFLVPTHHSDDSKSAAATWLFVPLGYFRKIRIPDLTVRAPDGASIAVLSRSARGSLVLQLFSLRFREAFVEGADIESAAELERVWWVIETFVSVVSVEMEEVALTVIENLESYLLEIRSGDLNVFTMDRILKLFQNDEFWSYLFALSSSTPLVASMQGEPGRSYVVALNYTEDPEQGPNERFFWLDRVVVFFGFSYVEVSRRVINFGSALSLWVIARLPDEAESLRFYWESRSFANDAQTAVVNRDRAVLGSYEAYGLTGDRSALHLQLRPSATIVSSLMLAVLLAVVSTYIYEESNASDVTSDPGLLITLLAAVPGVIAGRVAYGRHNFLRIISRGPRLFITMMSVLSVALTASLTFRGFDRVTSTIAFSTATMCAAVIVSFIYIQAGPRWRKNGHSRRPKKTGSLPPETCKDKQRRESRIAFFLWLAITIGFGYVEYRLREHLVIASTK